MYEADPRIARRTLSLWLFLIAFASWPEVLLAQELEGSKVVEAFTLVHQPPDDIVEVVRSLLSADGRVEIQGDNNTLVIRDDPAHLAKAREVLQRYDHPRLEISFSIRFVEAAIGSSPKASELPPRLVRRLQKMLRYERFEQRGHAELVGLEGEVVQYRVGLDFVVRFRVGTLVEGRRLRLHDFQVLKRTEGEYKLLVHTRLVLRIGQTMVLGLAKGEESGEALMVVVESRPQEVSPPLRHNSDSP